MGRSHLPHAARLWQPIVRGVELQQLWQSLFQGGAQPTQEMPTGLQSLCVRILIVVHHDHPARLNQRSDLRRPTSYQH